MIRMMGMIALAALATATAGAQDDAAPQRVLVVVAHPDDELFMAPAIAALAREGAQVRVIHATQGDAGPGVSNLPPGEKLAQVRAMEAFCSVDALGARTSVNLKLGDGKLGIAAHHPGSQAQLLGEGIAPYLMRSDLVLTWGPDGGYGHADHRMVSVLTTQIVQAMSEENRPRLLYVAIPTGSLPPVPEMARWATTDPALLTETIAYTPADLAAAKAAAQCHVTQFDAASREGMMGLFDATMWRGRVHFRPAF
ncbi:PIG-L family deacetylase [Erythrobacter sp. sf7]|uniref:PIG-L family deacetylase n=1 Tax=Erythrobacter fulvus TaxID=2987523 RepID=A0ABT5JS85_9SPHN|nr:PIG-L family deacetylase [Erythrobacter fulvus]MDC8755523.1 PIG-L family deacetylase [Erythrobacter fulvus]